MAAPVAATVTAAREREWNIEPPNSDFFLDGAPELQTKRATVNRESQPERGQAGPQQHAERETRKGRPRGPRVVRQRRGRLVRHGELIADGASCPMRIRGGSGVRASVLPVMLHPAGPGCVRMRA
jgi:hypothetical protein